MLRLTVSKGTYVRTLINDLGEALGTLAVMHSLTRTRSGAYTLRECRGFSQVERAAANGAAQTLLLPTDSLFPPVSYTHLDVYKRQSSNRKEKHRNPLQCAGFRAILLSLSKK